MDDKALVVQRTPYKNFGEILYGAGRTARLPAPPYVPVAQRIERSPAEAEIEVQFLVGTPKTLYGANLVIEACPVNPEVRRIVRGSNPDVTMPASKTPTTRIGVFV